MVIKGPKVKPGDFGSDESLPSIHRYRTTGENIQSQQEMFIRKVWNNYSHFFLCAFDFRGTTARSAYWLTSLNVAVLTFLFFIILSINAFILSGGNAGPIVTSIAFLYLFAIILPSVSMNVRRLRDAGFSPFLMLLALVPYIGGIVITVLLCFPTKSSSGSPRKEIRY